MKKIVKKSKGVLPSDKWLIKNGYADLIKCMKKHPEMFTHIKQNKEPVDKGDS